MTNGANLPKRLVWWWIREYSAAIVINPLSFRVERRVRITMARAVFPVSLFFGRVCRWALFVLTGDM